MFCFASRALELMSAQFSFFDFDVDTQYALFRDCLATVILTIVTDVTSTVGSGATVFYNSRKVTMEFQW